MIAGILIDKVTKRKVLGFEQVPYTVDEYIKMNGLDKDKLLFIPKEDLKMELSEVREYHLINEDGTVEDTRPLKFEYLLEDSFSLKGQKVLRGRRIVHFTEELSVAEEKELEKELNMKIEKKERVKSEF